MLDTVIPKEAVERFEGLRPGRKLVMFHYFRIYSESPKSPYQIVPKIAQELGYKIDVNGSNTYLLRVIQEFFRR